MEDNEDSYHKKDNSDYNKPHHPVQPVVVDSYKVYRFKENKIVKILLEAASEGRRLDLNMIAMMDIPREDRVQFAQLIGYSVSGWGDLSYVSDEDYELAHNEIERMKKTNNL